MEFYHLTRAKGEPLSHYVHSPNTPEWGVIHYLARVHRASKEMIFDNVPGAGSTTLLRLRLKGIIANETGVSV